MARRKPKTRTRKVHAVDWYDATGCTEWTTEADALKSVPALVTTVGIILVNDAQRLVIASTVGHGDDGTVGDVTTVPAPWVKGVELLGEVLIVEQDKA